MRIGGPWVWWLAALFATCGASVGTQIDEPMVATTNGAIAIVNFDQQIAQVGDQADAVEPLLLRARFLGDYEALDRASAITEGRSASRGDLLRRAQTRAAVHRFADALADLDAAERLGASADETDLQRSSILVATGHASEVAPRLERKLTLHPGFAARCALAGAYAATGRFADADGLYAAALADLDTTLPLPYAWVYFARGLMWTEQAKDLSRGAEHYARALGYLPQFVGAAIHLAEIEAARGDAAAAMRLLEPVVAASDEPQALALLGQLHDRLGDSERGRREIAHAQARFESLLARHRLAFADHAAEFFLGAGRDAGRAWELAQENLANRETARALALAIRAAEASGHDREARALRRRGAIAAAGSNCGAHVTTLRLHLAGGAVGRRRSRSRIWPCRP